MFSKSFIKNLVLKILLIFMASQHLFAASTEEFHEDSMPLEIEANNRNTSIASKILTQTYRHGPFLRWFTCLCDKSFENMTWKNKCLKATKHSIFNIASMTGMIGFHYLLVPQHSASMSAMDQTNLQNYTSHSNDTTHHLRRILNYSETQMHEEIGHHFLKLFIAMELGMGVGHVGASIINLALIDPLYESCLDYN